jgi:uncharacterized repeat protein (TIGR04076 family)
MASRHYSSPVKITVKEVRGHCAAGYKPGDEIQAEKFYIKPTQLPICLHALAAMLTLLTPFMKGIPATALGIGTQDHIGYVQCPDPGPPYTCGGTVLFELRREATTSTSQ